MKKKTPATAKVAKKTAAKKTPVKTLRDTPAAKQSYAPKKVFSVGQFLVYALLNKEPRSCIALAYAGQKYLSYSHAFHLTKEGVHLKHLKILAEKDHSRSGPPSRMFALTDAGKKQLAEHRKNLRFLLA